MVEYQRPGCVESSDALSDFLEQVKEEVYDHWDSEELIITLHFSKIAAFNYDVVAKACNPRRKLVSIEDTIKKLNKKYGVEVGKSD